MTLQKSHLPILSVIGKSGSGKTTLLEKLIPEFKRRGYHLATVKHHSHPGFEIDQPGKDTWRHAQAGSDYVVIAAPDKLACIRRLERELSLDEIAADIQDVDIILTEGYKRAGKPALEVVRAENGLELICDPQQLFAIASDTPLDTATPVFDLEDITGVVDLIESRLIKGANLTSPGE
jgi:molybdopterin-guanine dinucleotide biosynthesis protein B